MVWTRSTHCRVPSSVHTSEGCRDRALARSFCRRCPPLKRTSALDGNAALEVVASVAALPVSTPKESELLQASKSPAARTLVACRLWNTVGLRIDQPMQERIDRVVVTAKRAPEGFELATLFGRRRLSHQQP